MRKLKLGLVLGVLAAVLAVGTALALQLQVVPAAAKHESTCSVAGAAGAWGHSLTGTLVTPNGAVPFAAVGRSTFNADGTWSGMQTSSVGGTVGDETMDGTWTVSPDCSGTMTANIRDQSGQVTRTAVWALAYDDNQTEVRGIIKSLVKSGAPVPAIVTMNARQRFPNTDGKQ